MEETGHKFIGPDPNDSSYVRADDASVGIGSFRWSMYNTGILFTSENKREFTYIKPYFNRHWDGEHYYIYNPPEKDTSYAVVSRAGNIIRICFDIFAAYRQYGAKAHKEIVNYCIKEIMPDPCVKAQNLPSTARIGLTEGENHAILHVKVTYPEKRCVPEIVEEHQYLPVGKTVKVKGKYKAVFEPLEKTELPFEYKDGYTAVTLPEIHGYIMVILEK